MTCETLRIRRHNERALDLKLHHFKADFIDTESERIMRIIKAQREAGKSKDVPEDTLQEAQKKWH